MENAGLKGTSRRQQRKGKIKKNKKAVHFQPVRHGGFEETQVICYLWDIVKLIEMEQQASDQETPSRNSVKLAKQLRGRIRVEIRRYFSRQKRRSVKLAVQVLFILFGIITLFTGVLGVDRVDGDSMYPYLNNGDWIIYNRIGMPVKRDDVVVFEKKGESLVKRVIGLPGDTVEISASGGRVVVNGVWLREPYMTLADPGQDEEENDNNMGTSQTVMDGQYLVLGDNRSISIDSRDSDIGTVAASDIQGSVVLVFRCGWQSVWNREKAAGTKE